jgi:8-oxo-dGTP pyrophosphatase MutT (NUDIX family)
MMGDLSNGLREPRWCCAILRDGAGRYLLERRPGYGPSEPERLTCFGGKREAGETGLGALLRELHEELGWTPAAEPRLAVVLKTRYGEAWFYVAPAPAAGAFTVRVKGHEGVWVESSALAGAALSPWHRAAIEAEAKGVGEVGV